MAYILSLETSTTVCSVALHQEHQLLSYAELQMEKSHSSHITVMVQQVLEYAGVSLQQLDAVAVSGGPGSYTGLRIGSGTAKGLCFSLDKPLIAVSTLEAMARQIISVTPASERYLFCPMIDARRSEVYTCLLSHALEAQMPVEPMILEADSFAPVLENQPIIFFGSGAAKAKELLAPHPNAFYLENVKPTAKAIGELAFSKLQAGQFEDVAYYEPFYLKEVYITKPTGK
ncbi:tRNA (adenosine(37)-N6)-threonylcarbamoyltransferase complex dimerization subunit type 1 TsaB [Rufibacter latericius]|uniref:tRNA (Adenosine(37)-N6)-threonylcarbamoyltransferase complex dimerization subunit type 1 TsaB n=1 Tax=Rufibacter latericius TaxID=2487040 RepID=A0A3M9MDY4_9BACT|nr:tRNA (adenosine(37)-N6)-threonylcarbamoyltransferase complex dimerization subunit type 1 TsaB [Rufibacter latericius]RNI23347.1 tRNA (adenosine(37)-N6)-threonylcarbamoyltransferase complex dimerization subunit type 1 TsaB [Rufibacter latericius]